MAKALFRSLRRAYPFLRCSSSPNLISSRYIFPAKPAILSPPSSWWDYRNFSHGSVNLVISQGKAKFEIHEVDPPKKEKWQTKKRLKLQRKREKEKRKAANRKDPRCLGITRKKKGKFANPEERIKYKIEKAKIKEALLVERLKRYEVPKVQGPEVKPHELTGEERFFIKKMGQKRSNYVPVGRRGIFAGLILNMHMHWKKHETVKVICNSVKPGQIQEYADDIARLSGGLPIQIIGDDTIIFYRGKNYVQPEVMSPVDTLSKKKAYEKSKYEQSLESVRHFIAVLEKELELYHRHIALYGDPNNRNPLSILDSPTKELTESRKHQMLERDMHDESSQRCSDREAESIDQDLSESEDGLSEFESDSGDSCSFSDEETEESSSSGDGGEWRRSRKVSGACLSAHVYRRNSSTYGGRSWRRGFNCCAWNETFAADARAKEESGPIAAVSILVMDYS